MSQDLPRYARAVAGAVALTVGVSSALLFAAAGPASAASGPRAQSVGRFLDGQLGPQTLEDVLDLKDARATNPGTVTDQNPLDVTLAKQQSVPLTGAAQLPGSGNAIHFGAANQVAKARSNGYAYGASGAVANSGGASVGGNNNAFPASATVNLSAAAVPSPGSLPLPGAGNLAALGGVTATIGAVSALAQTPVGFGKHGSTDYGIAGLQLSIGSPALGGVLAQLGDALVAPAVPGLPGLPKLPGLPASCSFKTQALSPISLDGGAITIDPTNGSIGVDFAKLVNLNSLPANTDLLDYLINYLSSSSGLAKGLQATLNGIFTPLQAKFVTCLKDFAKPFPAPLNGVPDQVFSAITGGQAQVEDAINKGIDQLTSAAGSNPLAPLSDGLKKLIDIGVNVQPNGAAGSFTSALKATPDQATSVIAGQTIVRALEINLAPAAGSSPAATLAIANAAAGPSTPAVSAATTTPTTPATPDRHTSTAIPTGVPAGAGTHGGSPTTPLVLLSLGLALAGAGAIAWKLRIGRYGA
jgi:hypothetical protein